MVRKFKLINSDGAEWDLMRKDGFLYAPDGLGINQENEYMRIGSTYELIQRLSAQKAFNFTMVFSGYDVYREFSRFIIYAPLKLAYMPLNEWAYADGDITVLEKSEINHESRRLECDAVFTATSLWYIPRAARRTSPDVESPKRYDYTYDYTYADAINGYIAVVNDSNEDAPATISIMGPVVNPSWYVSVNNEVVASGAITATVPRGNKIVINSKDGYLEVAEYTAENVFVRNLYQFTDFSRETFVLFPPGNSVLFISGSSDDPIEAWVQIEEVHDTI
jgi:hypothetical protein